MAFYHVGSCSCPMGCCDCYPDSELEQVWLDNRTGEIFLSNHKQQDAYVDGNNFEREPWWLTEYIETGKWIYLGRL